MSLIGKNWHAVVMDNTKRTNNIVFSKMCLSVKEANDIIAEKKIEYPKPQYTVSKEKY